MHVCSRWRAPCGCCAGVDMLSPAHRSGSDAPLVAVPRCHFMCHHPHGAARPHPPAVGACALCNSAAVLPLAQCWVMASPQPWQRPPGLAGRCGEPACAGVCRCPATAVAAPSAHVSQQAGSAMLLNCQAAGNRPLQGACTTGSSAHVAPSPPGWLPVPQARSCVWCAAFCHRLSPVWRCVACPVHDAPASTPPPPQPLNKRCAHPWQLVTATCHRRQLAHADVHTCFCRPAAGKNWPAEAGPGNPGAITASRSVGLVLA